uniref:DUF2752 domain-containing protein n=1 Tax=Pedobacter schmidteae TaxID=2201271 RepID=UPI000EB58BB2|nr:DUF2752 domain-containing protein [Pedobacter schmidteae]
MNRWKHLPFELFFWITALVLLGTADVSGHETHFTLCPLANMGFKWCPGCGIGHAIAHLLQGDVAASIKAHWFGIPALLIISYRIVTLIKMNWKKIKIKNKEEGYV